MSSLIESIKSRAYKLEFDDIGFCKAKIPKELSNHLKEFVFIKLFLIKFHKILLKVINKEFVFISIGVIKKNSLFIKLKKKYETISD